MFPFEPNEYVDEYPHIFFQDFQNNYASSSSSSSPLSSSHGFFNSSEFHHLEMHHQPPPNQQQVINHDLEKMVDDDQGLKFSLWKNEDQSEIKWMSSKMRLMRKMKKPDNNGKEISTKTTNSAKFEDHHNKQQLQTSPSSDHFSLTNVSSRYDNHHHHHPPIRVCADCNTTKTPLWRSGPKGPKSLCNACGIRQRKARRAMAAASAAENGKSVVPPAGATTTTSLKIKVQNKEFKKRCKPTGVTAIESSDNNNKKKNGLEEFLFNLSKSLAIHRVFPQEEKDAAILLMALSCNRVHG